MAVNCATLSETLLESELFGHERGAFTGAVSRKTGKVEAADTGTLFLDEIGEIPLPLQAKLLRFLQEREFERLGSTRPVRVDVRVIAATNRNLEKEARACLTRYDWPGNVRELGNAIERAIVLGEDDLIRPEDLPEAVLETGNETGAAVTRYHETLNETKKRLISNLGLRA